MTARAQLTLALVSLFLLAGSAARLLQLDGSADLAMRTSAAERVDQPGDGSLVGVMSAAGNLSQRLVYGVGIGRRSRLLVFTIHAANAARDAAYWDDVIQLLGPPSPTGPIIGYWGVCDRGDVCAKSLTKVGFSLLGYLDLYEMRAVALADLDGNSLLYRSGVPSAAQIPRAATPGMEAKLVMRAAVGGDTLVPAQGSTKMPRHGGRP